ncbi:MAG: right-handed parallel beta-helix repeat-containing protein [Kiritimatiellae bacterium]|jgi:hypothetical protein|nr:right-handed parallel beta-helix repeat-containing protein [Kiritimatiellia bacterium]
MKKVNIIISLCWLAGLAFGQGSLTPPGSPAPTMKSLSEIDASLSSVATIVSQANSRIDVSSLAGDTTSHHIVSESGSYVLTKNLDVTKDTGIDIQASNVTLDLNGFKINGFTDETYDRVGTGIQISSSVNGCRIINGSIIGFNYGILSTATNCLFKTISSSVCVTAISSGENSQLVNCRIYYNTGNGILAGNGSVLDGCTADYNSLVGIKTGDDCILTKCMSVNNNAGGIETGAGSSIADCTVRYNTSFGIKTSSDCLINNCMATENTGKGFVTGSSTILNECVATDNNSNSSSDGFNLSYLCIAKKCVSKDNSGSGISTQYGANISDCISSANSGDYGIKAEQRSLIAGSCSSENSSAYSDAVGISIGENSLIAECTANQTTNTTSTTGTSGTGIYAAGNTCFINKCTVNNNLGYGIRAYSKCRIVKNQIIGNGIDGIYASGSDNCIDENNLQGNSKGIKVITAGNFITRNTSSGNGSSGSSSENYSITGYQSIGTIYEYSTLILFGNPRGPWGNYSY